MHTVKVKNPVLSHGASSKEKAILAIHPRSSERGILAFSREFCMVNSSHEGDRLSIRNKLL